ncbi:hypothetical protein N305_06394, partial [Manacus vitellinus]
NFHFVSRADFLCIGSLASVHHCRTEWMCSSNGLRRELCQQVAPEQQIEGLSDREQRLVDRLYNGLIQGHRACLAEAITLVESTQSRKKKVAQVLLQKVLSYNREQEKLNQGKPLAFRVGLSGPPGAGKSTFIECFGKMLTERKHKVSVLAVDPSSSTSGGECELKFESGFQYLVNYRSISLGQMQKNIECIRFSFFSSFDMKLGKRIAKYDSKTAPVERIEHPSSFGMCVVCIDLAEADAQFVQIDLCQISYNKKIHHQDVMRISAKTGEGISDMWDKMTEFRDLMLTSGELVAKRRKQQKVWMWNLIQENMLEHFRSHLAVRDKIPLLEEKVLSGVLSPGLAADLLLKAFKDSL